MSLFSSLIGKNQKILKIAFFLNLLLLFFLTSQLNAQQMKVGVFRVDASPPIGSPVAYAPAQKILDPLSARGIVILSDEKPIVLCTVDWLGVANKGQDLWRKSLAKAAKTSIDRVFIHALHQHDGLRCDFTTEKILKKHNLGGTRYDKKVLRSIIKNASVAVGEAHQQAQPVTHLGFGKAKVEKVASNRRILGEDGKVAIIRWSKSKDPAAIAAPEGLIDPWLKCVSLWNEDTPIAVMTYYATHPQSYYGAGEVTSEFVGLARKAREDSMNDLPHIHFNGAGGNVAAGKYNDGSEAMRPILTARMETAMKQAWEASEKTAITTTDLDWIHTDVSLPLGTHLIKKDLKAELKNEAVDADRKLVVAKHLAWLKRTEAGHKITVSSLRLGQIRLLNLPGELFIEYQLAAQEMKPDEEICTAAYGEYGPGYIGTAVAYSQGGYETSNRASRVGPGAEAILMAAIKQVLK